MPAYDETYLAEAMGNLAECVDYAVNACKIEADRFAERFIASGRAQNWEMGNPAVLVGRSGTELARDTLEKTGMNAAFFPHPVTSLETRSPEYWGGWVLAFYQWRSGRTFQTIQKNLPLSQIIRKYYPMHEAPEDKFADFADGLFCSNGATHLHTLRRQAGKSQHQLAVCTGVNIRSIQQYEQRVKDINHASGETLFALAKALNCSMEDLLENISLNP